MVLTKSFSEGLDSFRRRVLPLKHSTPSGVESFRLPSKNLVARRQQTHTASLPLPGSRVEVNQTLDVLP